MLIKNEQQYENDFMTGTPDIITINEIIDVKNSFDPFTFPLIETGLPSTDYWWQGQGYMELASVNNYRVSYCLCNTPQDILDKLLYHGLKGLTMEAREIKQAEIIARHNFDNIPSYLKIKGFPFVRDPDAIKAVYARVDMCREYIKNELKPKLVKHIN